MPTDFISYLCPLCFGRGHDDSQAFYGPHFRYGGPALMTTTTTRERGA